MPAKKKPDAGASESKREVSWEHCKLCASFVLKDPNERVVALHEVRTPGTGVTMLRTGTGRIGQVQEHSHLGSLSGINLGTVNEQLNHWTLGRLGTRPSLACTNVGCCQVPVILWFCPGLKWSSCAKTHSQVQWTVKNQDPVITWDDGVIIVGWIITQQLLRSRNNSMAFGGAPGSGFSIVRCNRSNNTRISVRTVKMRRARFFNYRN